MKYWQNRLQSYISDPGSRLDYTNNRGDLHRKSKPAVEFVITGSEMYFIFGHLHRLSGPAFRLKQDHETVDYYFIYDTRLKIGDELKLMNLNLILMNNN